jgi:hypothetical protein
LFDQFETCFTPAMQWLRQAALAVSKADSPDRPTVPKTMHGAAFAAPAAKLHRECNRSSIRSHLRRRIVSAIQNGTLQYPGNIGAFSPGERNRASRWLLRAGHAVRDGELRTKLTTASRRHVPRHRPALILLKWPQGNLAFRKATALKLIARAKDGMNPVAMLTSIAEHAARC